MHTKIIISIITLIIFAFAQLAPVPEAWAMRVQEPKEAIPEILISIAEATGKHLPADNLEYSLVWQKEVKDVFERFGILQGMEGEIQRCVTNGLPEEIPKEIKENTRAVIFELPKPIKVKGRVIWYIKVIGIFPKIVDGIVMPHVGLGYRDENLIVNDNGYFEVIVPSHDPQGGSFLFDAVNREEKADQLFSKGIYTQVSLGHGEFSKLLFNDQALGFAILGIEDPRGDMTLGAELKKLEGASRKEIKDFLRKIGRLLYRLHSNGYVHGALHFDNFCYSVNHNFPYGFSDLETVKGFGQIPEKALPGKILIDIVTVTSEAEYFLKHRYVFYRKYPKINVLRYLLEGYFEDFNSDRRLSKLTSKELKRIINEGASTPIDRIESPLLERLKLIIENWKINVSVVSHAIGVNSAPIKIHLQYELNPAVSERLRSV